MNLHRTASFVAAAAFAVAALPTFAQGPVEGPQPTTALINATSKGDVPLDPAMLTVQINGKNVPIQSVQKVGAGKAQIVILIDDGLRSSFGLQLEDMSKFIMSLPSGTPVMIGYMQNGGVTSPTRGFITDHKAVVDSLRIPFGAPGISASPYFCLGELVKHWPTNIPGPRYVLMLSNGVDPYNGSTSILNQDSPYVQQAQEEAQRAGVAVYPLYFGDVGMHGGRANFSGQSYLQQVAEATGGYSLYMMNGNPVSIAPYLDDFAKHIDESYQVSFLASDGRSKPGTLQGFKVKTSQQGVKVHGPQNVRPGLLLQ
jgi:hypothetical protein